MYTSLHVLSASAEWPSERMTTDHVVDHAIVPNRLLSKSTVQMRIRLHSPGI